MKHFRQLLAAAAVSMTLAVPAQAETVLTVHYPMPGFFKDVMDTISKKFMEENPDIKIAFANPSATYEEGIQTIMRQAGTAEMPDITFIGLNRLRMLNERDVPVDLGPFIGKDGNMAEQGFSENILKLAQVGGKQVGLAFATSNPIMYYNADLVRKAGGDPDSPPKTWDEVIELGGKIKALGDGVEGIDFRWQGDDWMFSALLFGAGGRMLTEDESKVAFNGEEGRKAIEVLDRMVKEGGLPVLAKQAGEQAFVAGKIGFAFQTTGALRNTIKNVGDKFGAHSADRPCKRQAADRRQCGRDPDARRRQAECGVEVRQVRCRSLWRLGRRSGYRLCAEQRACGEVAGISRELLQGKPALPRRSRTDARDDPVVCLPRYERRQGHADDRREPVARRRTVGDARRGAERRGRGSGKPAAAQLSYPGVPACGAFCAGGMPRRDGRIIRSP